ncbi:hypothetical protein GOP47_0017232, partial [Adiantum capillus-veneris]
SFTIRDQTISLLLSCHPAKARVLKNELFEKNGNAACAGSSRRVTDFHTPFEGFGLILDNKSVMWFQKYSLSLSLSLSLSHTHTHTHTSFTIRDHTISLLLACHPAKARVLKNELFEKNGNAACAGSSRQGDCRG